MDTGPETRISDDIITIRFGNPDEFVMIWGIQFLIGQFQQHKWSDYECVLQLLQDAARGVCGAADCRDLSGIANGLYDMEITPEDFDDNGLFF